MVFLIVFSIVLACLFCLGQLGLVGVCTGLSFILKDSHNRKKKKGISTAVEPFWKSFEGANHFWTTK